MKTKQRWYRAGVAPAEATLCRDAETSLGVWFRRCDTTSCARHAIFIVNKPEEEPALWSHS